MGRYTTVQTYGDNNPNMRSISYENAIGTTNAASNNNNNNNNNNNSTLVTEKVSNPYGSTAGAGSSEFHVYRHARAREMQRLKQMDQEEQQQLLEHEWNQKLNSWKEEETKSGEKRKKKREREKERKIRKKNMMLGGIQFNNESENCEEDNLDEEFEYTPIHMTSTKDNHNKVVVEEEETKGVHGKNTSGTCTLSPETVSEVNTKVSCKDEVPIQPPFANDGSFLSLMKKMQQQQQQQQPEQVKNFKDN